MIEISKYAIELHNEHSFSIDSTDNIWNYNKIYYAKQCDKSTAIEFIGVRCNVTGVNVLLVASGSPKGISEKSYIIENGNILVCVGNSLFSLSIQDFSLNWTQICDDSCCFEVFPVSDYFLIHGELSITALSSQGNELWRFYGRDIFVTVDGSDSISFCEKGICIRDWECNEYLLNIEGKLIQEKTQNNSV